jgi:antibiotic biosynthesis monooxygenase (ABM) superfamily enzyme
MTDPTTNTAARAATGPAQAATGPAQIAVSPAPVARPTAPNRHRLALLVLIGVYPLITAIIYGVAPFTAGWEIWQRNLVIAPIMVAAMVYGMIPFIQTRFRAFLSAGRKPG